jgi:hypothetical protein
MPTATKDNPWKSHFLRVASSVDSQQIQGRSRRERGTGNTKNPLLTGNTHLKTLLSSLSGGGGVSRPGFEFSLISRNIVVNGF